MVLFSQRVRELLDFVWFYTFILIVIVVYFYYSNDLAIYLTLGMMVILLISYFPDLMRRFHSLQYASILKICKKYDILREEELVKLSGESAEVIHSKLFQMQNLWNQGPFFIFNKRNYIYVSKPVIDAFVDALCKKSTSENNSGAEEIKILTQKYGFQTRIEVDALVLKIRENNLIEQRMKNEIVKTA